MKVKKCGLCGKKCERQITIRNRINGKELKICRECREAYGFQQEENVSELDTGRRETYGKGK